LRQVSNEFSFGKSSAVALGPPQTASRKQNKVKFWFSLDLKANTPQPKLGCFKIGFRLLSLIAVLSAGYCFCINGYKAVQLVTIIFLIFGSISEACADMFR